MCIVFIISADGIRGRVERTQESDHHPQNLGTSKLVAGVQYKGMDMFPAVTMVKKVEYYIDTRSSAIGGEVESGGCVARHITKKSQSQRTIYTRGEDDPIPNGKKCCHTP